MNTNFDCDYSHSNNLSPTIQYLMIVGINDERTNMQVLPEYEALTFIINICNEYFSGYSVVQQYGEYTNIFTQEMFTETSFAITILDTNIDLVREVASIFNTRLNQSSVIITETIVLSEFYKERTCKRQSIK